MTYEIYRYIFFGGAALAVVMLAVTVFMFKRLEIPKVIGDLTGANAKKAIENIRTQAQGDGSKPVAPLAGNGSTGKINASGKIKRKEPAGTAPVAVRTATVSSAEAGMETTVLDGGVQQPISETTVLDGGVQQPISETTVLGADTPQSFNETTVLGSTPSPAAANVMFVVEQEITYIHTNEVIS